MIGRSETSPVASVDSLTVTAPVLIQTPAVSTVRTPPRTVNGRSVESPVGVNVIPLSPAATAEWPTLTIETVSVTVFMLLGIARYGFQMLSLERISSWSSVWL